MDVLDEDIIPLLSIQGPASVGHSVSSRNGVSYRAVDRATNVPYDLRIVPVPPHMYPPATLTNRLLQLLEMDRTSNVVVAPTDAYVARHRGQDVIVGVFPLYTASLGAASSSGALSSTDWEEILSAVVQLCGVRGLIPHGNVNPDCIMRRSGSMWCIGDFALLPPISAEADIDLISEFESMLLRALDSGAADCESRGGLRATIVHAMHSVRLSSMSPSVSRRIEDATTHDGVDSEAESVDQIVVKHRNHAVLEREDAVKAIRHWNTPFTIRISGSKSRSSNPMEASPGPTSSASHAIANKQKSPPRLPLSRPPRISSMYRSGDLQLAHVASSCQEMQCAMRQSQQRRLQLKQRSIQNDDAQSKKCCIVS